MGTTLVLTVSNARSCLCHFCYV